MPVKIIRNEPTSGKTCEIDDLKDDDSYMDDDGEIYIINKYLSAGIVGFGICGNVILFEDAVSSTKLIPINLEITVC